MKIKSMGGWLAASMLAGAGCAHNAGSAQNPNTTGNQPVATQDQTGSTNPNDQQSGSWGTGAGTSGQSGSTGTMTSEKGSILSKADASQPGVIQEYSDGTLTLTSRDGGMRQTPRLQTITITPGTPIFSGDTRVSTDALVPGSDVRVYYKSGMTGDQKQIIGVDILKPTQNWQDTGANPSGDMGNSPNAEPND